MTHKLSVKSEALQDMTAGFDWYENKRSGLGIEFLDEVDEFFERITQNPEQYQTHQGQRVAVMHRFPYKIVYEIEQETIVVYAVYHDRRSPEKLSERT